MTKRIVHVVLVVVTTAALALLIVRWQQVMSWLAVHLGIRSEGPPYYAFWSGFGSDLGEYVIVYGVLNGLYLHWRFINCHEPWCPRVRRHASAGGTYWYCTRHLPGHGDGKMPSREHRERLHKEHLARRAA